MYKKTAFLYTPKFLNHIPGDGHPERPDRLVSVVSKLKNSALWQAMDHHVPESAIKADILSAHSRELVEFNLAQAGQNYRIDGDTVLSEDSIPTAMIAAGTGVLAVELIMKQQKYKRAFCAVRPPGHHAEKNRSMGFCIFNNVAVAACYAIDKKYAKKVLIVDWDVHHGNGTQDIFYQRNDVFYLSVHQSALYPGSGGANETGSGAGAGYTLNFPLPAGTDDLRYTQTIQKALDQIEQNFTADLVIISAGFDSHFSDPIGGMQVTESGFKQATNSVLAYAERKCEGRVISMLEGGYNLDALASSVEAHLQILGIYDT